MRRHIITDAGIITGGITTGGKSRHRLTFGRSSAALGSPRRTVAMAAIAHYTRYLAKDLGPFGITANCIAPSVIATIRIMTAGADQQPFADDEVTLDPALHISAPPAEGQRCAISGKAVLRPALGPFRPRQLAASQMRAVPEALSSWSLSTS